MSNETLLNDGLPERSYEQLFQNIASLPSLDNECNQIKAKEQQDSKIIN
jgi:hypothetical protein